MTELKEKIRLLKEYKYIFDLETLLYVNKDTTKAFSIVYIESVTSKQLEKDFNEVLDVGFKFYFKESYYEDEYDEIYKKLRINRDKY